ncbi:universal stress protein [Kineococcus sp. SYSU DK001]|uniref:universal stress protein n=1 Tax=Kineococcus sp. SYSU DK001 TaxID=3383122 RepID=UPI003D7E457F
MHATTVGFSGSGASRRALRWAVQDCAAADRPLHVLLGPGAGHTDLDAVLAEELLRVPGREPRVDVTVTTDDAAHALLAAAARSDLLVLGCGHGLTAAGPGTGEVLAAVLARCPVPVVLVGPRAVLTATRRVLVLSSAEQAVADWAVERGPDLPLRLLTTWQAPGPGGADRRHAHLEAAGRHHLARARLSSAGHRPVHADVVEGAAGDVVPQRLVVGDLVVVAGGSEAELPVGTLRAPVVVVPPGGRPGREHVVDLRERATVAAGR